MAFAGVASQTLYMYMCTRPCAKQPGHLSGFDEAPYEDLTVHQRVSNEPKKSREDILAHLKPCVSCQNKSSSAFCQTRLTDRWEQSRAASTGKVW